MTLFRRFPAPIKLILVTFLPKKTKKSCLDKSDMYCEFQAGPPNWATLTNI